MDTQRALAQRAIWAAGAAQCSGQPGAPAHALDTWARAACLSRTRSGDVVRLVELLDEAKQRCADGIRERRTAEGEQVRRSLLWPRARALAARRARLCCSLPPSVFSLPWGAPRVASPQRASHRRRRGWVHLRHSWRSSVRLSGLRLALRTHLFWQADEAELDAH